MAKINQETLPKIKSVYEQKCSFTGLKINKGDAIFYDYANKHVIKAVKIEKTEDYAELLCIDSWLFEICEELFWIKIENSPESFKEQYFADDACYSKIGAIHQCIHNIFEEIQEEEVPFAWLHKLDYEVAFE